MRWFWNFKHLTVLVATFSFWKTVQIWKYHKASNSVVEHIEAKTVYQSTSFNKTFYEPNFLRIIAAVTILLLYYYWLNIVFSITSCISWDKRENLYYWLYNKEEWFSLNDNVIWLFAIISQFHFLFSKKSLMSLRCVIIMRKSKMLGLTLRLNKNIRSKMICCTYIHVRRYNIFLLHQIDSTNMWYQCRGMSA